VRHRCRHFVPNCRIPVRAKPARSIFAVTEVAPDAAPTYWELFPKTPYLGSFRVAAHPRFADYASK
jgi:hypothetical protein